MAIDNFLDILVNLDQMTSKPERPKRDALFKALVAPGLILTTILFWVNEIPYLKQLENPVWFYIVFILIGLVLAVILAFLFLVIRLLTSMNLGIAGLLLLIGIGLSIAGGSYFNRKKDARSTSKFNIETRWFDYIDEGPQS